MKSTNAIETLADFVRIVVKFFPNNEWLFRGQTNLSDDLRPKAGRNPYFLVDRPGGKDADLKRFDKWLHQSVAFSTDLPDNRFERLAYAQHHGLATRLLDWTLNAAAALYFATEDQGNEDKTSHQVGGVFFYRRPEHVDEGKVDSIEGCQGVKLYQPRPISPRIIAQDSVFTIHSEPRKELKWNSFSLEKGPSETDEILAMHVAFNKKRTLQEELRAIGIHRRLLFPDIEGLSGSINCTTNWMAHPRR